MKKKLPEEKITNKLQRQSAAIILRHNRKALRTENVRGVQIGMKMIEGVMRFGMFGLPDDTKLAEIAIDKHNRSTYVRTTS
jgi:hypothetical protein